MGTLSAPKWTFRELLPKWLGGRKPVAEAGSKAAAADAERSAFHPTASPAAPGMAPKPVATVPAGHIEQKTLAITVDGREFPSAVAYIVCGSLADGSRDEATRVDLPDSPMALWLNRQSPKHCSDRESWRLTGDGILCVIDSTGHAIKTAPSFGEPGQLRITAAGTYTVYQCDAAGQPAGAPLRITLTEAVRLARHIVEAPPPPAEPVVITPITPADFPFHEGTTTVAQHNEATVQAGYTSACHQMACHAMRPVSPDTTQSHGNNRTLDTFFMFARIDGNTGRILDLSMCSYHAGERPYAPEILGGGGVVGGYDEATRRVKFEPEILNHPKLATAGLRELQRLESVTFSQSAW